MTTRSHRMLLLTSLVAITTACTTDPIGVGFDQTYHVSSCNGGAVPPCFTYSSAGLLTYLDSGTVTMTRDWGVRWHLYYRNILSACYLGDCSRVIPVTTTVDATEGTYRVTQAGVIVTPALFIGSVADTTLATEVGWSPPVVGLGPGPTSLTMRFGPEYIVVLTR